MKKQKNKKRKFTLFEQLIIIVLMLVIIVCLTIVVFSLVEDYNAELDYREIADKKEKKTIAELQLENSDIVGWLQIPITNINYPVMWTPTEPEYYLYVDFNDEYSDSGSLFLSAGSDVGLPTYNWLIHGHNMKVGTMFHDLRMFRDKDFAIGNPTFTFETITGVKKFEVLGFLEVDLIGKNKTDFEYYKYDGMRTEEEYVEYINSFWEHASYTIADKPTYPKQLISLSTCGYDLDSEERFVVLGAEVPTE